MRPATGKVIGAGAGRGIALLIMIAGMALAIAGIVVSGLKSVKTLERRISKNETIAESCPEGL
jgi:Tfp pilus assembly protein PilX